MLRKRTRIIKRVGRILLIRAICSRFGRSPTRRDSELSFDMPSHSDINDYFWRSPELRRSSVFGPRRTWWSVISPCRYSQINRRSMVVSFSALWGRVPLMQIVKQIEDRHCQQHCWNASWPKEHEHYRQKAEPGPPQDLHRAEHDDNHEHYL